MESQILAFLAVALLGGLLSGKVMRKIHLPNVTGYLIVGLLLGPYCLGFFSNEIIEKFTIIQDVALGLIAFSIGSEFKISYLKKVGKAPVVIAICEAVVAVIAVDVMLIITGHDIAFSLVLGAIAAATAPASTLMVVKQYKAKGPVTDTLLPVVAIDDAVALMAFGLSVAVAKAISSTAQTSILQTVLEPVVEIGGALVFGGVLGIVFSFLTKWFTGRGNRLSIIFALVFLCVGISNEAGFSSLLACMAMSSVYSNLSKESEVIFNQLDRMTPPIYILFFFISGAQLDLSILPQIGVIGVIYIICRVAGKVTGAALGARWSHAEPIVQKWLGFTLLPQEGVAIGLATLAMTVVPETGATIRAVILCGTIIYELCGPVITKVALMKAGEISSQK